MWSVLNNRLFQFAAVIVVILGTILGILFGLANRKTRQPVPGNTHQLSYPRRAHVP